MRRFFYAVSDKPKGEEEVSYPKLSSVAVGKSIALTEAISHHWCRVLRATVGDIGVLFDGFGGEYTVQLHSISKKQASATLLHFNDDDRTAPIFTKIGLVISRGDRMDYAIQKSTELGVSAIQLLSSHHGEVTLKPAQIEKKLAHWQHIAIAACEQCGMNRVPLILSPLAITQWLDNPIETSDTLLEISSVVQTLANDSYYQAINKKADIRLQMSVPRKDQPLMPEALAAVLALDKPYIELLVGPEGGLSDDERQQAEQVGFLPWQLGTRVLRTETAPVVALATLQALKNK